MLVRTFSGLQPALYLLLCFAEHFFSRGMFHTSFPVWYGIIRWYLRHQHHQKKKISLLSWWPRSGPIPASMYVYVYLYVGAILVKSSGWGRDKTSIGCEAKHGRYDAHGYVI